MRKALVVDANDVKQILAEHFKVKQEDVIKSQYSYTVIIGEDKPDERNEDDQSKSECIQECG